jgi:hypothetical protein
MGCRKCGDVAWRLCPQIGTEPKTLRLRDTHAFESGLVRLGYVRVNA